MQHTANTINNSNPHIIGEIKTNSIFSYLKMEVLVFMALVLTAIVQILVGYQLYKEREVLTKLRAEERFNEMESRLLKTSLVLKYLLDKAKEPSTMIPSSIEALSRESDLSVAEVMEERLNLRTGPGLSNAPLMTVSKGTKLVIETTNGAWTRVIAPNGARAWALTQHLLINPTPTV